MIKSTVRGERRHGGEGRLGGQHQERMEISLTETVRLAENGLFWRRLVYNSSAKPLSSPGGSFGGGGHSEFRN